MHRDCATAMTMNAGSATVSSRSAEEIEGNQRWTIPSKASAPSNGPSPVGRVERQVLGDLALPAVAVREQPLLVVVELLARLGGELEVRALDDGVHRAGLLAEAAIDALRHVDVVARGAARAVVARGSASMVMACAGQIASHSLQAMQRSSPLG